MAGNNNVSHKLKLPFIAYEGKEPYIFVSYKHADDDLVYPVIKRLHDMGFNIWYDGDLPYGKNYDIQIANHIKKSSLFVNFITKTSMDCANDEEDYMIKEFGIARNFKKNILPIYLEDVELDGYYLVHLLDRQSIFKHEYGDNEDAFIKACADAFVNDFNLKPNEAQNKEIIDFPAAHESASNSKTEDSRLTTEYLKEFEKLNTTTESIFELGDYNVLIILKDGTNLTDWEDVKNRNDVVYVSEDLSGYTNLGEKYKGLKSLKAIVTPKTSSKFSTLKFMFDRCEALVDISALGAWNVSKAINFNSMFKGCKSLSDISPLKEWNVSLATNFNSMFKGCSSLVDVGALGSWNVQNVADMGGMFKGCSSLVDLSPLSDWNISISAIKPDIFADCPAIKKYPSWDESKDLNENSLYNSVLDKFKEFDSHDYDKITDFEKIEKFLDSIDDELKLLRKNYHDTFEFQLLSDNIARSVKGKYVLIVNSAESYDNIDFEKILSIFEWLIELAYTYSTKEEIHNNIEQIKEIMEIK